jgi:hypothetical protein
MCHPVGEAYSHCGHLMQERLMQRQGSIIAFEEALDEFGESVGASLYAQRIAPFLRYFPRERFLSLTLDDLRTDLGGKVYQGFVRAWLLCLLEGVIRRLSHSGAQP